MVVGLVGEAMGQRWGCTFMAVGLPGCCQASPLELGMIYTVAFTLGKFLRLHVHNGLATFLIV